MPLLSMPIIESLYAETDGDPVHVPLTWRERWLPWRSYAEWLTVPWEPWIRSRTVIPKVPAIYQLQDKLIVHPALMPQLRALAQEPRR